MSNAAQNPIIIKKPVGVEEKTDLELKEQNDTFWCKRIIKYAALILFVIFCAFCLIVFFHETFINRNLQLAIVDKILDNIIVLFISALSIFGFNFAKKI
jgi:hypothetical protein